MPGIASYVFSIRPASERALIIYLDSVFDSAADKQNPVRNLDPNTPGYLAALIDKIRQSCCNLKLSLIPSYASLLVEYDPFAISYIALRRRLTHILQEPIAQEAVAGRLVRLPVYYHPEVGPDLARVAEFAKCQIEEVISRHAPIVYSVYAIGFAPGFAYLGEVDATIAAPRLASPRQQVPAGSVAIAQRQTAVYPNASPGGWNLIGRCPTPLFDLGAKSPMRVGDRVQFQPIDRQAFIELGGEL
mgnify:CR=1 FL=1